jgi:Ca2+-dependent lipid-binding protein
MLGDLIGGKFIRVRVVEARDLLPMDSNGLSDPFCVVTFNDEKKNRSGVVFMEMWFHFTKQNKSKTTEIIYKCLNPVWSTANEFTFRVTNPLTDTVKLVVWDYDNKFLNDYEGLWLSNSKNNICELENFNL